MNISQFDKQNIKALRVDIDAALKAVGTKYGIVLQAGRCKFMPKSAAFNLEASTISSDGDVITRELETLKHYMPLLGLTEAHVAQSFRLGNKTFKIDGYKPRCYAKPFQLRCIEDGRTYVATERDVKFALKIS